MASSASHKIVRPRIHITVPYWLNDPCAPAFDPNTGLYHMFYQSNPFSTDWGNMSWGHVTSKDLVRWEFMPKQPALAPDEAYDKEGIFTGGMSPIGKDKRLHVFYSSICNLPFHWHTPPYPRNSAGLAMATSEDGGKTWVKSKKNPILPGEPADVAVSGYRDPYIAHWENMDHLRQSEPHLYGLVSGGIDTKGPTSFLYAIHPDRQDDWRYLGPLVDLPLRWNPSEKWSGNFGINWECVNFMTLSSQPNSSTNTPVSRDFLILGAEGDTERSDVKNYKWSHSLPVRTIRTQVWMQGTLTKTESGQIRFQHGCSGLFDHGPYYAANSFVDPKSSRRIVHGWVPEEDTTAKHCAKKGWQGCLALPREVFVLEIPNVVCALRSPLESMTNIEVVTPAATTSIVRTMGVRPISELTQLRESALRSHSFSAVDLSVQSGLSKQLAVTSSATWELEATIAIDSHCETVGFHLRHSHDLTVCTTLTFNVTQEKITLDRSKSIADPAMLSHVNTCPDSGPFTLFTIQDPESGKQQLEKLYLRIVSDGDVLEVFVNDRFALGTVVYTGEYETCGGVTAFASNSADSERDAGSNGVASFETVKIWDGLNRDRSLLTGWEHVGLKSQDSVEESKL